MKNVTSTIIAFCIGLFYLQAQNVQVSLEVITDQDGSEVYWELVPTGSACGNNPIASGGNTGVGCNGGGTRARAPGGYANRATIQAGTWSLTDGASYDLIHVDEWGDGGTTFNVKIEGFPVYSFEGKTAGETFTFLAAEPPTLDVAMGEIETALYQRIGDIDIHGHIFNQGQTTITSLDLHYEVDNGPTQTTSLTALNILPFTEFEYDHPAPWTPTNLGPATVRVWMDNINNQGVDDSVANNENSKVITVLKPIPNIIASYADTLNTFSFVEIVNASDRVQAPRDLDFHPNGDLWVINTGTENSGGSTITISDPGEANQQPEWKRDGNAWHFMSLPSGIAFSNNGNFATSTSVFDANHNGGQPFTGPALWSSDPAIYAQPSGGNGSHLDMLHQSPYCMGIAHEKHNVFWVTDMYTNDVVRYDFAEDHGPGNADHADAVVRRYPGMPIRWVNQNVASHLVLDKSSNWLYVVDGGNNRVVRLDITSGTPFGTPRFGPFEPLAEYTNMLRETWEIVVDNGLSQPSGIDVIGDYMVISEYSSGDIITYDISTVPATELSRIKTNEPGTQGLVIGPEGKIWYTNSIRNKVVKIEPAAHLLAALVLPKERAGKTVEVEGLLHRSKRKQCLFRSPYAINEIVKLR